MKLHLPLFFMLASLSVPAMAAIPTASGTVDFTFTSFSGPYNFWGGSVGDTSKMFVNSTVNGVVPTYDSSAPQIAGDVYGRTSLSGASVNFNEGAGILPNVVSFDAVTSFSGLVQGEPFKIGTLTFENGSWFGGHPDVSLNTPTLLGFTITTHSDVPAFNQVLSGVIVVTTNYNTDCSTAAGQANGADFISIGGMGSLGSLHVYDSGGCSGGHPSTGSIDLIMKFNSLDYVKLANPQGGFFVPNADVGPIGGAPEPATWSLMILGVAGVGGALRTRRRKTVVA